MTDFERVVKIIDWLIFEGRVKSRRELAECLGYRESSLSQITNGRVPLANKFIKKLSIFDNRINIEWISTGEGSMTNDAIIASNSDSSFQDILSYLREREEEVNRLNREIGRLEELLAQTKKTGAQEESTVECVDANKSNSA